MKLLIASDIHGSAFWCRCLCDLIETERPAPGLRAEAGDPHAEPVPGYYHCGAGQL